MTTGKAEDKSRAAEIEQLKADCAESCEGERWADRVIGWAEARNILKGTTAAQQYLKLMEEVGELAEGIQDADRDVIKDSIGDALVVAAIIANQSGIPVNDSTARWHGRGSVGWHLVTQCGELARGIQKTKELLISASISGITHSLTRIAHDAGMTIDECREAAWKEIKDRKGRIEGGVFVKE